MSMMTRLNKLWIQYVLFLIILIGLFFFLGMWEIFFSGPQGIHFIRQTDSLSFASQYFNCGYHFFEPKLFNLNNIEGKAACEFPITYYFTALLYAIFGKNVLILKLLHFIILSTGVFFIFRLSYLLILDYFYAIAICLFLFTSTVFNYYSFNYLPDAPALGFTFLGWFFISEYLNDKKKKTLVASFVFFTLGSLIKVTYLINPLTILILALFTVFSKRDAIIPRTIAKKILFWGALGLSIVLLWNIYILYYNSIHDSNYFYTKPLPIWNLSKDRITEVWDYMRNHWHAKYFAYSSFQFLYIILLFQIIFIKKSNYKLSLLALILFLGSLSYFILFYSQFKDHDYYFLAFFPLAIFVIINGLKTLQNISKNKYLHVAIKLILSVIIIVGINYSRMKLHSRYENTDDDFSKISQLIHENKEAIEKLNFPQQSKFIIAPDPCPNGGLFFLDRMGWNIGKKEDITVGKIDYYRDLGADYLLLVSDDSEFLSIDEISSELTFKGKGIEIHKLKNTTDNE